MPGFDGTGPRGMGPMTGGGRGFCSPWGIGAAMRYGFQGGYGAPYEYPGIGTYPGYPGATFYPPPTPGASPAPGMTSEQELDYLRNQVQAAKSQLEQIESRMRELEKK